MSEIDIEAIRARADAATVGPWELDTCYPFGKDNFNGVLAAKPITYVVLTHWDEPYTLDRENLEFIAHARTDIPMLIAEVESLRAKLAEGHLHTPADTEGKE